MGGKWQLATELVLRGLMVTLFSGWVRAATEESKQNWCENYQKKSSEQRMKATHMKAHHCEISETENKEKILKVLKEDMIHTEQQK